MNILQQGRLYFKINYDGELTEDLELQDNVKIVPAFFTRGKYYKFRIPRITSKSTGITLTNWISTEQYNYYGDIRIQFQRSAASIEWKPRIDIKLIFRGPQGEKVTKIKAEEVKANMIDIDNITLNENIENEIKEEEKELSKLKSPKTNASQEQIEKLQEEIRSLKSQNTMLSQTMNTLNQTLKAINEKLKKDERREQIREKKKKEKEERRKKNREEQEKHKKAKEIAEKKMWENYKGEKAELWRASKITKDIHFMSYIPRIKVRPILITSIIFIALFWNYKITIGITIIIQALYILALISKWRGTKFIKFITAGRRTIKDIELLTMKEKEQRYSTEYFLKHITPIYIYIDWLQNLKTKDKIDKENRKMRSELVREEKRKKDRELQESFNPYA